MWVAIGVIGGVLFTDTILLWVLLYRLRAAEQFLMIISGVVLQSASMDALAEYIKSRGNHPAGKQLPNEGGQ
jgi:hypothetical protein